MNPPPSPPAPPPAAQAHARLEFLLGADNTAWNGIDYVEIASVDQTQLRVHFLTAVTVAPAAPPPLAVTITGGEVIGTVAVLPIDPGSAWSSDADGRPVLSLAVATPGDFSTYTLTIANAPALDPYFDSVAFSFKANCPSDFDCDCASPAGGGASPIEDTPVQINYLVKDFGGFTQALSDFSALRYPGWVERSEADLGTMMLEALSAIADELSYYQDRVATEATIATATQRVSLVRHARLVDYEPAPATAATTTLQLEVGASTPVPAGLRCSALGADGTQIPFEVGDGLTTPDAAVSYPVDPAWNAGPAGARNLEPYWWDTSQQTLAAGATTLWLFGTGHKLLGGQQLLIDTAGATSADPPVRELVTIAQGYADAPSVVETEDPVFASGSDTTTPLTQLTLAAPTTLAHDLALTHLAGNLVPAVQGERLAETFAIPVLDSAPPAPGVVAPVPAVVRTGPNWTPERQVPIYRHTLSSDALSWLPVVATDSDSASALDVAPQIVLTAQSQADLDSDDGAPPQAWEWQRWLLDSAAESLVYTLTPERYSLVGVGGGAALAAAGTRWYDYDGDGVTIMFGDGELGLVPAPGTVFTVTYLSGGGVVGNVPADTIVNVQQPAVASEPPPVVTACTNPFPATGGGAAETAQQIRDHAPQAFRAEPLRVVLASDYVAAAQSEPWVQQAGTACRWTGSWMTVFTTADPAVQEEPSVDEIASLSELLNRRRLAGYESYVTAPQYTAVDLEITVYATADSFSSDVAGAVTAQLAPGTLSGGGVGFFDHSRWGFGDALEASALLAAVQAAAGVLGVLFVSYRQRGLQPDWAPLPQTLTPPANRILRVDNDPSRPEAGSLRVIVEGGK